MVFINNVLLAVHIMRFKHFLKETSVSQVDHAISKIEYDCKFYLSQRLDNPLLRGIDNRTDVLLDSPHPKNRSSLSSSDNLVFWFDAMAQKAKGIHNIRQTSVFVTGSKSVAEEYGSVYLIFPKGQFEFIWSPYINDSYYEDEYFFDELYKLTGLDKSQLRQISVKYGDNKALMNAVSKWILDIESGKVDEDNAKVLDGAGELFDVLGYRDSGLNAAINYGNEILIYKSEGYHLIKLVAIYDHMRENGHTDDASYTPVGAFSYVKSLINVSPAQIKV